MQGWDGFAIHTYAYGAHLDRMEILGQETSSPIGGAPMRQGVYTTALDPAKYGLFYHAALITRRGDIKESETSTEVLVHDLMTGERNGPVALKHGSELEKIGVLFEDEQPVADRVVEPHENVVPDGITEIRSTTRELYRNWKKQYGAIDSERTKAVYGFLGKNGKLDVRGMSVEAKTDFAVVALSSLTDASIEASDSLLLTTIGRVRNTDMRYEDGQVYDIGHAPVVVEVIKAEVAIRTKRTDLICWAVNAEGYYVGKVPARYEDGCLKLTLGQTMPSMYYLIQSE